MRLTAPSLIVLAVLFIPAKSYAQPATTVNLDPDRGLVVKRDSTFELLFRFRMQDRAAFTLNTGDAANDGNVNFLIRRFRLKLEGFAITPRLKYKIQLGLSEQDQMVGDGFTPPSPLLDAMVFYALTPHTSLGFGQGKLPGGREALVSSGEMELPERPLANSSFTIDRDMGFFLDQNVHAGPQVVRLRIAVSQGEGRSAATGGLGLCYTGRLEWLPFGAFTGKDGDYMEGDLAREPKPKLSLATAYSTNRDARRIRGQNGLLFPDGQERTMNTFYVDALFKYKGWSWQNEFNQRNAEGSPLVQDPIGGAISVVNEGWGLTSQAGRMLGERAQVVARYSAFMPGIRVGDVALQREETSAGFNYYLNEHRIKLQSALVYTWQNGVMDPSQSGAQWGMLLQVELGI